ncbi:MAG: cell wall hydrolase [Xenococcus sp. (in: cyanobacteria)]
MTTAQQILDIARGELGTKEQPAGSNKTKYGLWYGMNGQPWCAMFVSWVFEKAGFPLPRIQTGAPSGFAYCPYAVAYYRSQGKFSNSPKVGDLVFFAFGSKVSNHVGIVESVNQSKGTVTTIEGNTSRTSNDNGGKVMRRIRSLSICYGFGRINYSGTPNQTVSHKEPIPRFQRLLRLTTPYMQGDDVLEFQKLLRAKGYKLDTDGIFGPGTRSVTSDFQADRGLEVDGIVGQETLAAAKSKKALAKSFADENRSVDILARTIYGEARGENYQGKIAVAYTIINRVESPITWWGDSIIDVCQHPYQYSCWNINDPNRSKIKSVTRSNPNFEECYQVAKKVVAKEIEDPTSGATHYYAKYIATPSWAKGLTPAARIYNHLFFKGVS